MNQLEPVEAALKAVHLAKDRLWVEAVVHLAALKRRELDTGEKVYVPRELFDALQNEDISNTDDIMALLDLDPEPWRPRSAPASDASADSVANDAA